MLLIGRATAAPLGEQKQHLVATVCEGMERLRPHCTRPGEQRSQHLRQGGGEVCDQGNRYGAKAVICSRGHLLDAGNASGFWQVQDCVSQAASAMPTGSAWATTPYHGAGGIEMLHISDHG
jgi:hypothetical protein